MHVETLLLPTRPTGHRKRVPKCRQTGGTPTSGWLNGHALAQPSKPVVEGKILEVIALFGHEKSVRQPVVV